MFYFIRHGEPDDSERNTKIYQGFGANLSRLSEAGCRQIEEAAKDARLKGAALILSSPYTRALQTAAILSRELGVCIAVETDLHEWLANKDFVYEDDAAAERACREYAACGGEYPDGETRAWEAASAVRGRIRGVLRRYASYEKVIAVCHGMAIQAVTGRGHSAFGGIVEFDL